MISIAFHEVKDIQWKKVAPSYPARVLVVSLPDREVEISFFTVKETDTEKKRA